MPACKACGADAAGLYCEACRVPKVASGGKEPGSGISRRSAMLSRFPGVTKVRKQVDAAARWKGDALVVTLPLPPRALSPNARVHWSVKAKAVAAYRELAEMVARTAGPLPCWEGATMKCVFYWPDKRRRDDDNASASGKGARDGIADAGLVRDDSTIRALPVVFKVDASNPRVELILSPV